MDTATLTDLAWQITLLSDALSLHAFEQFQKSREAIIVRQQPDQQDRGAPFLIVTSSVCLEAAEDDCAGS